jgi:SAM-dependent methyltransferase
VRSLKRLVSRMSYELFRAPLGYGKPILQQDWDRGYSDGRWLHLESISELSRYAVIAHYLRKTFDRPRILDAGCGSGILSDYLAGFVPGEYVGFDISADAIRQSNIRKHGRASFFVGSFDEFQADGTFDAVVFNESLGYTDDPLMILRRYFGFLRTNGVLIVSMHHTGHRSRMVWRRVESAFAAKHSTRLINESGQIWDIRLFERVVARESVAAQGWVSS